MSDRNPWCPKICFRHSYLCWPFSYWTLPSRCFLMVTGPRNDHQPHPAPCQPAYHCSVARVPVLYGHHSLCWTVTLYASVALSPWSWVVTADLSSIEIWGDWKGTAGTSSRMDCADSIHWRLAVLTSLLAHRWFLCPYLLKTESLQNDLEPPLPKPWMSGSHDCRGLNYSSADT